MRRLIIIAAAILALASSASAQITNPTLGAAGYPASYCGACTTSTTSFSTFQSDLNSASAGNVICYTGSAASGTLTLSKGGTSASPVTAVDASGAVITPSAGNDGIQYSASNIKACGFSLEGSGSGNGFGVVNTASGLTNDYFYYNTVNNFGASGFQLNNGDCVDAEFNVVSNNALTFASAGSGISVYEPEPNAACTTTWHTNISNNESYDNKNPSGGTDGNGIILDTFTANSYTGPSLISNNVIFGNFGACIKFYSAPASTITAVNNSCYRDQTGNWSGTWRGEIENEDGGVTTYANNIAVYDTSLNINNSCTNDGGSSTPITGANQCYNYETTTSQPFYNSPTTDFTEKSGSTSIGAGVATVGGHSIYVPATDIAGATRGATFDAGAYDITTTPTPTATVTPTATATRTATPTATSTGPTPTATVTSTPSPLIGWMCRSCSEIP